MRILLLIPVLLFCSCIYGQYPYVRKISYPDRLPTQVVYDMLTDSKGYIWLGTDKGLFRFNGRTFMPVPFDQTSSKSVSYLQEDEKGTIWCMNFYNQIFSLQNDTLRKFDIDYTVMKGMVTFTNVVVDSNAVWLQSFNAQYKFDKRTHKLIGTTDPPTIFSQIISSTTTNNNLFVFTQNGFLFSRTNKSYGWKNIGQTYGECKLIAHKEGVIGLGTGYERQTPFEVNAKGCVSLKPLNLSADTYIFQGVCINNNEYWLCTQNGAYKWNKETGETRCYLPSERVSDVVKDYQGNYWFSTLDNGVFICPSLENSLLKVYNDPLLDNFTRLLTLPNKEILTGNSQGNLAKINLETSEVLKYKVDKRREIEFIMYDSANKLIFSNRGVLKPDNKEPIEALDYSKGIQRDKYGNLLVSVFNGAFVLNDRFNASNRMPSIKCPLYKKLDTVLYAGRYRSLMLRQRRSISILHSGKKDCFWVGYEDGLYEYHYDGTIRILKDKEGQPVIAKSLQEESDGSLVVGSSTKGVLVFQENGNIYNYTDANGLSSRVVQKVLKDNSYIWALTDAGFDRIDLRSGAITNYLEEFGLSNTIINDFVIDKAKVLFATPAGILVRHSLPKFSSFEIKFPQLKASSNGEELKNGTVLPGNGRDIVFYFEALHYLSGTALTYRYRLKDIDTVWRTAANFNNQLAFYRLFPGKYVFEIKAIAGANYASDIKRFSFVVPRSFWQKPSFYFAIFIALILVLWFFLRRWKKSLLQKQAIKEQVLKSQLVALRAQMNPHFLYNVLNTVQGLVYGNRKTEAGELLGNFSDLMRKTLQASDKQLLPLKDEIENIRLYLELEKARFDEDFFYKIDVVGVDDLSDIYIPSLMLQPFVENSVKHGLMHKQGQKKVEIRFEKKPDGLRVVIDDNGIGREHSMEINKRSKNKPFSFATIALNERMELFNRLYKQKMSSVIIDKTDENKYPTGTKVELYIPDYSKDPHAL